MSAPRAHRKIFVTTTLYHCLASDLVASAESLGGEIAYANRLHTGHTRNQAVGIRYLTCDQSSALPVVADVSFWGQDQNSGTPCIRRNTQHQRNFALTPNASLRRAHKTNNQLTGEAKGTSALYITSASTYPSCWCLKAPGNVPTTA